MDKAVDKELYMKIREEADKKFERHSLYKSTWVLREYKKRGGTYKEPKPKNKLAPTTRWFEEKWIQVLPFLLEGKIIICGKDNKETKACRPTIKVDKNNTPLTIEELLKIHGKNKLIEIAKLKNANMDKRMDWRRGKLS